jgi:hypothetical protein
LVKEKRETSFFIVKFHLSSTFFGFPVVSFFVYKFLNKAGFETSTLRPIFRFCFYFFSYSGCVFSNSPLFFFQLFKISVLFGFCLFYFHSLCYFIFFILGFFLLIFLFLYFKLDPFQYFHSFIAIP